MREKLIVLIAAAGISLSFGKAKALPYVAYAPYAPASAQAPPVLEVTPARVTFLTTQGRKFDIPQRIRVRNAGGGQLVWRVRSTKPWLGALPQSGAGAGDVALIVDGTGLAAGSYSGQVVIEAGGAAGSPAAVDVTVTLANPRPPAPPGIKSSPEKLTLKATLGKADALTGTIKLEGEREAALNWVAKTDQPWIVATPPSGTTPSMLKVEASPEGLPEGTHQATVTILTTDGKPVLRVPVALDVGTAAGPLALATTSLPPATLNLPYSQAVPLKGGRPPYRVQLIGGSLPPELTLVNGAISGIARQPGTYAMAMAITDSSSPPVTITATLTLPVIILDYTTALIVQPPSFDLVATPAARRPTASLTIASGSQSLPWVAQSGAAWLKIAPAQGTAPATVTLTADAQNLAAGVYVATVTVQMDGAPNTPARIPIQLTVRK